MSFEINEAVWATVTTITNRTESHGEDDQVRAVSFGISVACDRDFIAARLGEDVADAMFKKLETDQLAIEEVPPQWVLRAPGITTVSLEKKLEGWRVRIAHGLDEAEQSTLVFAKCKLDAFRVEPGLRESIILFRCATSDVDAKRLGDLGMLLKQTVELVVLAPEEQLPVIDGSRDGDWPGAPGGDDTGDLLGGDGVGDPEDPEDEPDDPIVDEKPARRGRRTAVSAE